VLGLEEHPNFEKGLQEVKYTCQKGLKYLVENGKKKIRFWHEIMLGDCPLKNKVQ
jgi:hypothetical protein